MADIEHSVAIPQNIVKVYQAVTDYDSGETIKEWQPTLKTVGVTAGKPIRTGSMIALKKHFIMSEIFVNADVVDMQRNKYFKLKGFHGRFPFEREIEFAPNGRETLVKDRIWIKTGWLFFWWRPMVISSLRSQTAAEWKKLVDVL
ncbi:MAG: hypothetical protein AAF846_08620 [Chloroflexota bacterium]